MRLGPTGLIEVVSPFDAVTQAQLRAIRPAGSWHTRRLCWQFARGATGVNVFFAAIRILGAAVGRAPAGPVAGSGAGASRPADRVAGVCCDCDAPWSLRAH